MSEQEQSSSPEQTTSTEAAPANAASTEPETLDQVYSKFNVDQQASEFSPQRQSAPQQQSQPQYQPQVQNQTMEAFGVPDPILNSDQHKAWLLSQNAQVRQALSSLHQTQQQMVADQVRRKEEADISKAVSTVKAKVGEGVDDDFIEIALGQKARKDPRFLAIYNNRDKNPQAWNAALNAVSNEFKKTFAFKPDNQLAENVRAAKQSTQSSLTTRSDNRSGNPLEQRFEGKTGRDFDAEWRRLIGGGY